MLSKPLLLLVVVLSLSLVHTGSSSKLLDSLNEKYELVHINSDHYHKTVHLDAKRPRLHPSSTTFTFEAYNERFGLELEKNHALIPPSYKERHVRYKNGVYQGEEIIRTFEDVEHCFYRGYSTNHNFENISSYAAINTCKDGFQGTYLYIHTTTLS